MTYAALLGTDPTQLAEWLPHPFVLNPWNGRALVVLPVQLSPGDTIGLVGQIPDESPGLLDSGPGPDRLISAVVAVGTVQGEPEPQHRISNSIKRQPPDDEITGWLTSFSVAALPKPQTEILVRCDHRDTHGVLQTRWEPRTAGAPGDSDMVCSRCDAFGSRVRKAIPVPLVEPGRMLVYINNTWETT